MKSMLSGEHSIIDVKRTGNTDLMILTELV
jgi:hypothetical protein